MFLGIYNIFQANHYKHFGNNCIVLLDIWKHHIFLNGNAKENVEIFHYYS